MTAPQCVDPAGDIIVTVSATLADAFDPDPAGDCPPDVGGTRDVKFFASDGGLIWDANCKDAQPLLWVRVDRRYRSRVEQFPAAFVGENPCGTGVLRVLALEVGAARCAPGSGDAKPNWQKLAREAHISLDDSWRIETALCGIAARLKSQGRAVAIDTVAPVGPEGGVIAWTGMVYVQI